MSAVLCGCDRKWTGDIEGTVTDSETTTPIPGVVVQAASEKNEYAVLATTNDEGHYRISDARWGPNEVTAYHPRYATTSKYADVIRDKSVSIDFELYRNEEYVSPEIAFWVTDQSDVPIQDARINLYGKSSDEYIFEGTQLTDSDGRTVFIVSRLYENEIAFYRADVSVYGFRNQSVEVTLTWNDYEPLVHVRMESGL